MSPFRELSEVHPHVFKSHSFFIGREQLTVQIFPALNHCLKHLEFSSRYFLVLGYQSTSVSPRSFLIHGCQKKQQFTFLFSQSFCCNSTIFNFAFLVYTFLLHSYQLSSATNFSVYNLLL